MKLFVFKQRFAVCLLFLLWGILTRAAGEQTVINVSTAGTLSQQISSSELSTVTNLKLTGEINATDIKYIRTNGSSIRTLDMGETNIVKEGYNGKANSIPYNAFQDHAVLTSVILPSGLTTIENYAFWKCSLLSSISIPSSVTSIGQGAFAQCSSLTSISLPAGITSIGTQMFSMCTSLTSIEIPSSLTSIEDNAFSLCKSLVSVNIPSGVSSIGTCAFQHCESLTSISLPSSVTNIGLLAFADCKSLSSINFSEGIIVIGNQAFSSCQSLTSITLPSSVERIGTSAFSGCSSLTSVSILSSLDNIDADAFSWCNNLSSIHVSWTTPIATVPFSSKIMDTCILYVPKGTTCAYKQSAWGSFKNIVEYGGQGESEQQETCATPTISYSNGKLQFSCATSGAEYYYTITDNDVASNQLNTSGELPLNACLNISAYATANGYKTSETTSATLYWLKGSDDATNINTTKTRGILATADGGIVTVSGLNNGEKVTFYSADGRNLGSVPSENGTASLSVSQNMVIVKIGNESLKIAVK